MSLVEKAFQFIRESNMPKRISQKKAVKSRIAAPPATKAPKKKVKSTKTKPTPKHDTETIFKVYAIGEEHGRPIVDGEGIMSLAEDWNLDIATRAELLVFMWHCGCEEYGQINKEEFQTGCTKLAVTDFSDFKSRVPKTLTKTLEAFDTPSEFRPFYKFMFTFHRDGIAKNVEFEKCLNLLNLIYSDRYPLLPKFITFCQDKEISHLTLDQWDSIYDLLRENPNDLDNYDLMAAWPSLMDDFYEWAQNN